MRIGPGGQRKRVEIFGVEDLKPGEVAQAQPAVASLTAVKQLREVHHRIARLAALGLRNFQIAEIVGYSGVRISTLLGSPSMKNLIAEYVGRVDAAYERDIAGAYLRDVVRTRLSTVRQLADRVEASEEGEGEEIPLRTLVQIHDSMADRSGFGKHSVQVNINAEFGDRLDKAIKRTSTVAKAPEPRMIDVTPNCQDELGL